MAHHSDIDELINQRLGFARQIREHLTKQQEIVIDVAARWVAVRWEEEIRLEVERDPSRTKAQRQRLPALKVALEELRAKAASLAAAYLDNFFIHESTDEDLMDGVEVEGARGRVRVPEPRSDHVDEGLTCLVGAIGPALEAAGLSDAESVIQHGRYRHFLDRPAELGEAMSTYDTMLKDLILELTQIEMLREDKSRAEAVKLWRDA